MIQPLPSACNAFSLSGLMSPTSCNAALAPASPSFDIFPVPHPCRNQWGPWWGAYGGYAYIARNTADAYPFGTCSLGSDADWLW